MRQLVAIVLPERVHFYLDEGGRNVDELATIRNHGDLTVQQIIELGANLADALRVNGVVRPKPEAKKAPARKAPPGKRKNKSYGVTAEAVLEDVRAHPGAIAREVAMRVLGSNGAGESTAVNRRALELEAQGLVTFGERPRDEGAVRQGRPARTYTAIEPAPPPPPPAYDNEV